MMLRMSLPYHIFALHTIWNREQVYDDMVAMLIMLPIDNGHDHNIPQVAATLQPGSSYITIVRDPIDLFESLWSYASIHHHHF